MREEPKELCSAHEQRDDKHMMVIAAALNRYDSKKYSISTQPEAVVSVVRSCSTEHCLLFLLSSLEGRDIRTQLRIKHNITGSAFSAVIADKTRMK